MLPPDVMNDVCRKQKCSEERISRRRESKRSEKRTARNRERLEQEAKLLFARKMIVAHS
jgi:hypothetical protein